MDVATNHVRDVTTVFPFTGESVHTVAPLTS